VGSTTPGFNHYSIGEVRIENLNLRIHFDICWVCTLVPRRQEILLSGAHIPHTSHYIPDTRGHVEGVQVSLPSPRTLFSLTEFRNPLHSLRIRATCFVCFGSMPCRPVFPLAISSHTLCLSQVSSTTLFSRCARSHHQVPAPVTSK